MSKATPQLPILLCTSEREWCSQVSPWRSVTPAMLGLQTRRRRSYLSGADVVEGW